MFHCYEIGRVTIVEAVTAMVFVFVFFFDGQPLFLGTFKVSLEHKKIKALWIFLITQIRVYEGKKKVALYPSSRTNLSK